MVQKSKNVLYKFRFEYVILSGVCAAKNPDDLVNAGERDAAEDTSTSSAQALSMTCNCKGYFGNNEPCQKIHKNDGNY